MSSGGDSPRDELCDDLADDARELEPVARSAAGDDDVLVLRMQAQEEVLVGRVLEQARLQRGRRPGSVREVPLGELTQELLVALGRLAVELVRVAFLLEVVVAAELEAGDAEDGKSVVAALLDDQVEDREALRLEELRSQRIEPGEHLALRHDRQARELARPRAGGHHQPLRLVARAIGGHANAAARGLPLEYPLVRPELGPRREGSFDVRHDAALRQQESAVRLEHRHRLGGQAVAGKTPVHLRSVDHLVLEPVLDAGAHRALEDEAVRRSRVHRPGDVQKPLARRRLELAPELVGTPEQRYVARVLVVGEPDDSRDSVRRALLVRHPEALDARARAGRFGRGGTGRRCRYRRPRRRSRRSVRS